MTGRDRRRLRVTEVDGEEAFVDVDPPAAADLGDRPDPARAIVSRLPVGSGTGERGLDRLEVVLDGWRFRFQVEDARRARLRDRARRAAAEHGPVTPHTVRAQIPGRVVSVAVAPGEQVVAGQRLLAVEAMKMENEVRAPRAGTVETVAVAAGDRVELGDELMRIV